MGEHSEIDRYTGKVIKVNTETQTRLNIEREAVVGGEEEGRRGACGGDCCRIFC